MPKTKTIKIVGYCSELENDIGSDELESSYSEDSDKVLRLELDVPENLSEDITYSVMIGEFARHGKGYFSMHDHSTTVIDPRDVTDK